MRLDRFITLNLVQPFRRAWSVVSGRWSVVSVQGSRFKVQSSTVNGHVANGQPSALSPQPLAFAERSTLHAPPVPILMYHSISDDPEPGVSPYYKVNTRPGVFRQQMQFLADHGYRTISLTQLVQALTVDKGPRTTDHRPETTVHERTVCITFDDGFRDFYTEAFPVLQKHGFTATVFLPTTFIRDTRRQFRPSTLNRKPSTLKECLCWSEVRELRAAGIEFGSHTVTHPKLVELGWPEIQSELSNSKSEIEHQLGEPVTTFCYPFAFPDHDACFVKDLRSVLKKTGYTCCLTTRLGRVFADDDPYSMARLPVNGCDDEQLFKSKLEGAYDWLAIPQRTSKTLRSTTRHPGVGQTPN